MRDDRQVVRFRHLGDATDLRQAARPLDLRLDDVARPVREQLVELDTFDRTPGPSEYSQDAIFECARDPETDLAEISDGGEAVKRQKAVVDRVHDRGGEVILSAHVYKHLDSDAAVAVAERIQQRGDDFGKIVGVDETMAQALDTLEAHLRLNDAVDVPYTLMAIGAPSRIVRPIAPVFGSAWVFAQPELTPGEFTSWPLVDNPREILRRTDWRSAVDRNLDP